MKKLIINVLFIIALIFINGCAASYKPINPRTINYIANNLQEELGFSYKYDVLRERGNRKYARKEDKKGIRVVAVRITNNTERIINVGRDLVFYSGQNQILPVEPQVVKSLLKQPAAGYLFYLLLTPLNLYVIQGNSYDTYPIGLALGPGLSFGNMATAGSANKKLLIELIANNILYSDIQPGETIYGIIGVRDIGFNPLFIELISSQTSN